MMCSDRIFPDKALIVYFVKIVLLFMSYAIFCKLCDQIRFEVDCVKSYHHVISEGLFIHVFKFFGLTEPPKPQKIPIPSV